MVPPPLAVVLLVGDSGWSRSRCCSGWLEMVPAVAQHRAGDVALGASMTFTCVPVVRVGVVSVTVPEFT